LQRGRKYCWSIHGPEWEAAWQDYRIKSEMSKEHQPHPLKAEDAKAFYQKRPLKWSEAPIFEN
jgi:hypothetical protein